MQSRLSIPLVLAALAGAASAQTVQFNALIEKVPTDPCTGFEFGVESTDVLLGSNAVDLAPLVDSIVLLKGNVVALSPCPTLSVVVESVAKPTATLEVCGTVAIGCPVQFQIGPPTISANFLAVSVQPQIFAPLQDPLGVLFLDSPFFVIGSAGAGGIIDVTIPGNAPLGVEVTFQALHQEIGPIQGPGWLSNPIRRQLVLAFFCSDPTVCF